MTVEGDDHRTLMPAGRFGLHLTDEVLVTAMDAVERPYGGHGSQAGLLLVEGVCLEYHAFCFRLAINLINSPTHSTTDVMAMSIAHSLNDSGSVRNILPPKVTMTT